MRNGAGSPLHQSRIRNKRNAKRWEWPPDRAHILRVKGNPFLDGGFQSQSDCTGGYGVHVDTRRARHHGREEADDAGSFIHETAIEQDVQATGRNFAGQSWRAGEGDRHLLWRGLGQFQTGREVGNGDGNLERQVFLSFSADLEPEENGEEKGEDFQEQVAGERSAHSFP